MRKPSPIAASHLFTVRVWYEDLGEGRSEWRGEVRDVASGQQRYFRDWQGLLAFFQIACKAFEPDHLETHSD
jgi:hypothetical protein